MSENKAVRYFKVPVGIEGLVRNPDGSAARYEFAAFFAEFLVPRIPRASRRILQELLEMFGECKAGEEWELHAEQWQVMNDALPPAQAQPGQPVIPTPVYIKVQPFYLAVEDAPTKKPEGWGEPAVKEAQQEAAE